MKSCRGLFVLFLQNHRQSDHLGSQVDGVSLKTQTERLEVVFLPLLNLIQDSSVNTDRNPKVVGHGLERTFHLAAGLRTPPLEQTITSAGKRNKNEKPHNMKDKHTSHSLRKCNNILLQ